MHVTCSPQESCILFTDFAAAHPGVSHSWIVHVLEKAELPEFTRRFLRMIYCNSTAQVEFSGKPGDKSPWPGASDKVVRRAVAYSQWRWILFFVGSMTRSFQWTLALPSFRLLMTALSPAFEVVDQTSRLNLNHRKCCWVQFDSESFAKWR